MIGPARRSPPAGTCERDSAVASAGTTGAGVAAAVGVCPLSTAVAAIVGADTAPEDARADGMEDGAAGEGATGGRETDVVACTGAACGMDTTVVWTISAGADADAAAVAWSVPTGVVVGPLDDGTGASASGGTAATGGAATAVAAAAAAAALALAALAFRAASR